jgi:hypothetical protein
MRYSGLAPIIERSLQAVMFFFKYDDSRCWHCSVAAFFPFVPGEIASEAKARDFIDLLRHG